MSSEKINRVGKNILKKREGTDLSREALAEKLNVAEETVSDWENEKVQFKKQTVSEISLQPASLKLINLKNE